jgi:hypothetical protein
VEKERTENRKGKIKRKKGGKRNEEKRKKKEKKEGERWKRYFVKRKGLNQ